MGRDPGLRRSFSGGVISIHSPRMGRDLAGAAFRHILGRFQSTLPAWGETRVLQSNAIAQKISIHSPRMGRDWRWRKPLKSPWRFQSTLPAWGETCGEHRAGQEGVYFNPLSPHGERQYLPEGAKHQERISIHSPRMGRDHHQGDRRDPSL